MKVLHGLSAKSNLKDRVFVFLTQSCTGGLGHPAYKSQPVDPNTNTNKSSVGQTLTVFDPDYQATKLHQQISKIFRGFSEIAKRNTSWIFKRNGEVRKLFYVLS